MPVATAHRPRPGPHGPAAPHRAPGHAAPGHSPAPHSMPGMTAEHMIAEAMRHAQAGEAEGHQAAPGGGHAHEYWHPHTAEEIQLATTWMHLQAEKQKLETTLHRLYGQNADLARNLQGRLGLAEKGLKTQFVTSPTPHGQSYLELRRLVNQMNRLPPGSWELEKLMRENPDAVHLFQRKQTAWSNVRGTFWSLSLKRTLNLAGSLWEKMTTALGPLGKILNWPVQYSIKLLLAPLGELPTGPAELSSPALDTGQHKASELGTVNPRYVAHVQRFKAGEVAEAAREYEATLQALTKLAEKEPKLHNLALAHEGH